jgi:probable rRNA maturation factor
VSDPGELPLPIDPRRRRRPGPPDGEPVVFAADEQSALEVEVEALTRLAEGVLKEEGVRGASELTLFFIDETAMADLNERFMGGTGPTDVLAFPIDDDLPESGRSPDAGTSGPDRPPIEPSEVPLLLGDVLVCPTVAARNAEEHQRTLRDELALLVVHGTLHVLGMDHADEEETKVMQARERELLDRLHRPG